MSESARMQQRSEIRKLAAERVKLMWKQSVEEVRLWRQSAGIKTLEVARGGTFCVECQHESNRYNRNKRSLIGLSTIDGKAMRIFSCVCWGDIPGDAKHAVRAMWRERSNDDKVEDDFAQIEERIRHILPMGRIGKTTNKPFTTISKLSFMNESKEEDDESKNISQENIPDFEIESDEIERATHVTLQNHPKYGKYFDMLSTQGKKKKDIIPELIAVGIDPSILDKDPNTIYKIKENDILVELAEGEVIKPKLKPHIVHSLSSLCFQPAVEGIKEYMKSARNIYNNLDALRSELQDVVPEYRTLCEKVEKLEAKLKILKKKRFATDRERGAARGRLQKVIETSFSGGKTLSSKIVKKIIKDAKKLIRDSKVSSSGDTKEENVNGVGTLNNNTFRKISILGVDKKISLIQAKEIVNYVTTIERLTDELTHTQIERKMAENEYDPAKKKWTTLEVLYRSRTKRVLHAETLIPMQISFSKVRKALSRCPDLLHIVLKAAESQLDLSSRFKDEFTKKLRKSTLLLADAEYATKFHNLYIESTNNNMESTDNKESKLQILDVYEECAPFAVRQYSAINRTIIESNTVRIEETNTFDGTKDNKKSNQDEILKETPLKSLKACEWGGEASNSQFSINLVNIFMQKRDIEYLAWTLEAGIFLSVRLHACYINQLSGSSIFDEMRNNPYVTQLDLSWNKLSYQGAIALGRSLESNKTLTRLNLAGNMIGPHGVKAIANVVKVHPKLKDINLFFNDIGPAGANFLASGLRVTKVLKTLNVRYNNIGAAGAQRFAKGLSRNRSLTELYIADNHVGKLGSLAIASAFRGSTRQLIIAFGHDPYEKRRKAIEQEIKDKIKEEAVETRKKERDQASLEILMSKGFI